MESDIMNRTSCKLVTLIVEDELQSRITEELKSLGATGHTAFKATGEGMHHQRASEWEGENVVIQTLVTDETADRIMEHIADRYFGRFSVTAYVVTAEVIRGEKFH
jgi:nitrogen regulatory protein P-II 2